jgi:hypothetical protein
MSHDSHESKHFSHLRELIAEFQRAGIPEHYVLSDEDWGSWAASSPFRYMIWKANTRFELWKVEVIGTDWNRLEPPKYSSWMGDSYRDPERQYCFASKTAAQYVAPRTQKQRIRHQRKAQWWRVKLPAMESHLAQSIWNWSIVMMGFRSACWFVGGLEFSYIILKGIKINIPPPHWWLIVQLVNVVIL